MSLKTPTNVKECHLLVMKFFLNILEAYQDFPIVGVMFFRAIDWIPLGSSQIESEGLENFPEQVPSNFSPFLIKNALILLMAYL